MELRPLSPSATAFGLVFTAAAYPYRRFPPFPLPKTFPSLQGVLCSRSTFVNRASSSSDSEDDDDPPKPNDPYLMNAEERIEWRRKIKQAMERFPEVEEEHEPDEKRRKMQQLISDYPLVVDEEDPNWNEDADGWGFSLSQFFNKITITNNKKKEETDEDDDDESEEEIVWKDDNYIKPIKDMTTADWETSVFKDISPLIILVHNRYRRPKENEKARDELEKAVQIIWNCGLPSPRCVAVDAVIETDLVSALKVSIFPEIIFTKSGKILHREKVIRTAEEYSKIMAFFFYGGVKPPLLYGAKACTEWIPTVTVTG